ncbi:YceI family protein [Hymenobacter psoromatis]|uniref:YceI family protein n=1 Tax=Hymenobacter psoromatis TaxID=1484116 RepID=UPI001CBA9012|nr:YceI family protein [Hymenobacter psoromatis]
MRYARRLLAFLTLLLVASAFAMLPGGWAISPDYAVHFSGGKAEGTFSGLAGTVNFDPADPAQAALDVRVEAATISTGNKLKDKHARGDSWFDVEKYPTIRFASTTIARRGDAYVATGRLTLHGVTRPVVIPFHFAPGAAGRGVFSGQFTVNRHDYGIEGNFLGFSVGDEFAVELRVPVAR